MVEYPVLPMSLHEFHEAISSDDEHGAAFRECIKASIGAFRTSCAPEMVKRIREAMRGEMVRRTRLEPSEN